MSQAQKQLKRVKLYSGSRKTARATAAIYPGTGRIRINGVPLELWQPEAARLLIMAPVQIVGDLRNKFDIDVSVSGGGFMGQAEAVAMAISRAYVNQVKSEEIKNMINSYNKYLLSGDPRQTEPKKFGGPGPRRRRQKSYR